MANKSPYQQPLNDLYAVYHSSREGLSTAQANQNREQFGKNQLAQKKKKPVWMIFLEQCTPDISGTIQRFSGYYPDYCCYYLCNYRRTGKHHCHSGCHHHECDFGHRADSQSGKIAGQFEIAICSACKSSARWHNGFAPSSRIGRW